jgi:hypothetical protein
MLGPRVPTIVISPYAREHYIDHRRYDFNSVLRFIEDWLGLPALSRFDASSVNLARAFDFKQKRLRPLQRNTRVCPANATKLDQRFSGTIIRLRLQRAFPTITIRLTGQEIGTMQIMPSTRFRTRDGASATSSLLRTGDPVRVVVRPQPERALVFTLSSLVDRDLRRARGMRGVVTQLDPSAHQFVLHREGATDILVDFSANTSIRRAGNPVPLAELLIGQRVTVAGIINSRLREMVRTDRIDIEP